jgi:NADPH-dependent curcumin reductase CurA
MSIINQKVVLARIPTGEIQPDDFKVVNEPIPDIKDGEVLLKTNFFSLDPYMKKGMLAKAAPYFQSGFPDQAIPGASICIVEQSKNPNLTVGDLVLSLGGWQKYAVTKGIISNNRLPGHLDEVMKVGNEVKPSYYFSSLGMPGLTGYYGLLEIGQPKPGETVVVSAATGPVGSMVGQLATIKGCRAVGIAGSDEKCRFAVEELGFDACINHKSPSFADDLKKVCPNKIDVYFDNVGGSVFWTVMPQMNDFSRVALCGAMAWANQTGEVMPQGPDLNAMIYFSQMTKRIKLEAFIVYDHYDLYEIYLRETIPYIQAGKIKIKEDVVKGIENAPQAFGRLLKGQNFGKAIIEI